MKKIFKPILFISLLIIFLILLITGCRHAIKEINLENNNKELENLVIDELIEIYNSEVYTYTIEELPNAQEDIKYCCIIKFYDGQNYTERIMYIEKSNNVYTEIIIEDKVFE